MSEKADTVPHGVPQLEAETPATPPTNPEIIIITGMSGAGRSRAASVLEDLNWFVVDNLPPRLLESLVAMMLHSGSGVRRLAAVVDVRSGQFFNDLVKVLAELRESHIDYRLVFLDASDEVLVRRYEAVRRPHPLQGSGRMLDGIAEERQILSHLRRRADVTIDTSDLNVHDLARRIRESLGDETDRTLRINVVSFGFKYGLPLDADHVVDVRFISNPYWITELRHLNGKDEPVRDYVLHQDGVDEFIEKYAEALAGILPGYVREQKLYVTVAVGCTGGKHRSVAITEAIARRLRGTGETVSTLHRDLGRE
ncbi:MAG TPA: RNase adapter RapZ [Beutenbergiaceae bacterium]|nr:RNase adapter RapZ [Beutenbergiaceae bacterium]